MEKEPGPQLDNTAVVVSEQPMFRDLANQPGMATLEQQSEPTIDHREQLIEDTLSPYHIHYAEGIEGETLNPEAAEMNFDTLLVLSDMIRNRSVTNSVYDRETEQRYWHADPKYGWYFEKYADRGIDGSKLHQPGTVVKAWFEKLGPHNDLADAGEDLLAARAWLVSVNEALPEGANRKNLDLLADIDIELAEVADDDSARLSFLHEAAELLEKSVKQDDAKEKINSSTVARMKLSAVRVEMSRLAYLGTGQLTRGASPEDYADFEDAVTREMGLLSEHFNTLTAKTIERFDAPPDESLPKKEKDKIERDHQQAVAALFETFSYLQVMSTIIGDKGLTIERFRPGTIREESATAHHVDAYSKNQLLKHPNDRLLQLPDGSVRQLSPHGFNYNFDFRFDTLRDNPQPGEGIYYTVYYQNKLNPENAPADAAQAASQKFFAGKEFRFIEPANNLPHMERGRDMWESLTRIARTMQQVRTADKSSTTQSQ